MGELAPPEVLRAALHVLHMAGIYTRNWTLSDTVSREQINDLWEAVHGIPSELTHWRGEADFERAMQLYLNHYVRKWKTPNLTSIYRQARDNPQLFQ